MNFRRLSLVSAALVMSASFLMLSKQDLSASTNIMINSPVDGEQIVGNDVSVSGLTEPDSTVLLMNGNKVLSRVRSDADGLWSSSLKGLPSGKNAITARVVKNSGYAYFVSAESLSSFDINQLRFSDDSINLNSAFPLSTQLAIAFLPSPTADLFYGFPSMFNVNSSPNKLDLTDPSMPVQANVTDYPTNAAPGKGDFNADGTKYYSPNQQGSSFSIVDVASNTAIENIALPANAIYISRGLDERMYVSTEGGDIVVVNTLTDSIDSIIEDGCSGYFLASIFPADHNDHEYFYALCASALGGLGEIKKFNINTHELVSSHEIGARAMSGFMNYDATKIFLTTSALDPETVTEADKLRVFDVATGQVENTIQLSGGAVGILPSSDYQKLYIATPSGDTFLDLSVNNIDVVDMDNYALRSITTPGPPIIITSSPSTTVDMSDVQVGVVLGVADGGGDVKNPSLVKTGLRIGLPSMLSLFLIIFAISTYVDYRKHKKPIQDENPEVAKMYTYWHHIRVVTIPLARYRITLVLERR